MKTYTQEQIENKKIAVHTETESGYNEFMKRLEKAGIIWKWSRKKATEYNAWEDWKEETCIRLDEDGLRYCDKEFYKGLGYTIITPDQLILNGEEKKMYKQEQYLKGKIAVHTEEESKCKEFMERLEKAGIDWCDGGVATELNAWEDWKEETCIRLDEDGLRYCDKEFYKDEGYTIINPSQLILDGERENKMRILRLTILLSAILSWALIILGLKCIL